MRRYEEMTTMMRKRSFIEVRASTMVAKDGSGEDKPMFNSSLLDESEAIRDETFSFRLMTATR